MSGNSNETEQAVRSAHGRDRITLKKGLGCLAAMIGIPILALVLMFYVAGLYDKEWDDSRPVKMSVAAWQAKRARCEIADLSAASCATTSKAEVERLGTALALKRMEKLCARDDRYEALEKSKAAVMTQLRAPSTARFGNEASVRHDGCNWIVSGDVDAENAFGGTVRSKFSVRMRRVGRDLWLPLEVRVE